MINNIWSQHVHHGQLSDQIGHLFHAVDEEGGNEEDPGGEDSNFPCECNLSSGDLVFEMLIMILEFHQLVV